ncbi:hypothetical protein [Enterococcus diestrammenae]|uniref:hypothetical protein n=1 Tax=Enterococcus diestrammenae TaxID=1155073 RepID=UPI00195BABDE
MGLFDFLKKATPNKSSKPKKPTYEELVAVKFILEQKDPRIKDCIRLINKTTTPSVFFERYNMLVDELSEIINTTEKYKGYISTQDDYVFDLFDDYSRNKDAYISKLIRRMGEKLSDKVENLTTEKSKVNNIEKFKESLYEYKNKLNSSHLKQINTIVGVLTPSNLLDVQNKHLHLANHEDDNLQLSASKSTVEKDVYNQWTVSVSFGKSTSKNFVKAIYLAENSDRFITDQDESGNPIYQAFFLSEHFLDFQALYKIVGSWKSTFVFVDGELIDSKSLGKISICYGDKLKFHDPYFCYGASNYTTNPFGCHRRMITPSQTPWWSFGEFDRKGNWIIDKKAIKEKIDYKSILFSKCPAFNKQKALLGLAMLPDSISKNNDMWYFTSTGVMPIDYDKINKSIISLTE